MNAWRDIKITIIVEVDGERPIELTETWTNHHKDCYFSPIRDMADVFRVYAGGEEEIKKPVNERRGWSPRVPGIKSQPFIMTLEDWKSRL